MPWETVATYTDSDTGVTVEKQHRKRNGRGNQSRYKLEVTKDRWIYLSHTQLFDLTDTLDDVCDAIDDKAFPSAKAAIPEDQTRGEDARASSL
jgi:hypothetical protein